MSPRPLRWITLTLFATLASAQTTYTLRTIAGSDDVGDGGPATQALIAQIQGVAVDNAGNLYLADADGHRVRRIASNGTISTVAGTGHSGFSGDGNAAHTAQLNTPYGLAADRLGNIYIADLGNARIRRVSPDGIISTLAGGGATPAAQADGLPATSAALQAPRNVTLDSAGNVYFSDFGDHRIWEVTTSGLLLRVAGNGIAGFSGDNGSALAAQLNSPAGLAIDSSGVLYIADSANRRIRRVWRGLISTAGDPGQAGASLLIPIGLPTGVAIDPDGSLLIADSGNGTLLRVSPLYEVTSYVQPARDVAVDAGGTAFVCSGGFVVRRPRLGVVTVIAGTGQYAFSGDGGAALQARFNLPSGLARDTAGALYVADRANHRVRKITPDGFVFTIAGNGVAGFSGDGGPALAAHLNFPSGLAIDSGGHLYIADSANHRVRMIDPSGAITTVAGTGEPGFNGDNGIAIRTKLDTPSGVALDSDGNLYIADTGNSIVRRVSRSGVISIVAGNLVRGFAGDGGSPYTANLDSPRSVAIDKDGNLFIADTGNRRIRRVSAGQGIINTYPVSDAAVFRQPRGLTIDGTGNLFLTDALDNRIFEIEPNGRISTIGGDGWPGFNGEAAPSLTARIDTPLEIAADSLGNLYFADSNNNRIRELIANTEIAPPPTLAPQAVVVNAASLQQGPIVPGEIVSLFGTALADDGATTAVLVNSRPADISFTSSTQLNLRIPSILGDSPTADIEVTVNGVTRAGATAAIAAAAPGIFTRASGAGLAVAVNEDGNLNSPDFPAPRGSIVTLYATGVGDGTLPVTLDIGDYAAELLYAGPAPGFPGLTQINARVPGGFAPPGSLAVTLQAGTAMSQAGVVIEVR